MKSQSQKITMKGKGNSDPSANAATAQFGAGSRTCIGKNISLLEISKLVPEFVRRFDFELDNPAQDLQTQNVWFVKQKNFFVRVAKR
jgi:cytochrome P450